MKGSLMDLSDLEAALQAARDERDQFASALETAGEELGHIEAKLDTLTADLQSIAHELGIPARTYSGHEGMERDILPAIRRLRQIEAVYESFTTRKIPKSSYLDNPIPPTISEKEREWRGGS